MTRLKKTFELCNHRKEKTGLPFVIWTGIRDIPDNHYGPRIKIRNDDVDKWTLDGDETIVTIEEGPMFIGKNSGKISVEDRLKVKEFINRNRDLLLKHWRGEISDDELSALVKRI